MSLGDVLIDETEWEENMACDVTDLPTLVLATSTLNVLVSPVELTEFS